MDIKDQRPLIFLGRKPSGRGPMGRKEKNKDFRKGNI
jgi:hypothetical protein